VGERLKPPVLKTDNLVFGLLNEDGNLAISCRFHFHITLFQTHIFFSPICTTRRGLHPNCYGKISETARGHTPPVGIGGRDPSQPQRKNKKHFPSPRKIKKQSETKLN
jgi:hypothetical protein